MNPETVDRVVDAYGGRCAVGGRCRGRLQLHHIKYRSRGGSDRPENLVLLCAAHHADEHAGRGRGWSLRSWEPEPDRIPWRPPNGERR